MKADIRLAASPAECDALFAFRYRIYVKEMSRPQKYADHATERISDPLDETGWNFIAWHGDAIVGCVRVNFARDGGLDYYRDLLDMTSAGADYPGAASLCTRLMLDAGWRGSNLAVRLSVAAFECGLAGGIRFNFIDCNDHLVGFFERLGYEWTHRARHEEYGEVNAMRLDLSDHAKLLRAGSPFRRSLERRLEGRIACLPVVG